MENQRTGVSAQENDPKHPIGKPKEGRRTDGVQAVRFVIPSSVSPSPIEAVRYMGSAHLNAVAETKDFIVLEPGVDRIPEGTILDVRLI